MVRRICVWTVFVGLLLASVEGNAEVEKKGEASVTVQGTVFQDTNGNGRLDSGEKGISGVAVSNGQEIVATDSEGRYRLSVEPQAASFVFVTTPGGYRCSSRFYQKIGADQDSTADFGLVADPAASATAFSFAQITDIHMGMDGQNSLPTFLEDLAEINRHEDSPAFIVATGDLVTDGSVPGSYEEYLKGVESWPKRYYHVIGNHDQPVEAYETHLGPTYYSFDYGPVHFVVLNCLEPERYMAWLKRDLDRQPKDKTIIAMQHFQPDKALLELLSQYNTRAFLYGHWHSNKTFNYGKIQVISTPPLRFGGIDCSSRGYRVVTVNKDEIQTRYQWGGIAGLPEKKEGVIAGDLYSLAWKTVLRDGPGITAPLVDDGRIYIGLQDDDTVQGCGIVCLDSRDGKRLWKAKTDSSINGRPVVGRGILCAVSVVGTMYGFDSVSGQLRWTCSLGDYWDRWVYSSPVMDKAGKRVFCGTGPCFVGVDVATGKKIWQAPPLGTDWISCRSNPVTDDAAVYLSINWGGGLTAMNQADGSVLWSQKEGFGTTHSTPAVQGQTLFALADGSLYRLETSTGKKIWQVKIDGGWITSSPAVEDSILVVGTPDGKVAAVQTATGEPIWSFQTGSSLGSFSPYIRNGSQVMASPVISDNRVYVGANDGAFYVLELTTGKLLWHYQTNRPILTAATVTGDRFYFSDCKETVYAFEKKAEKAE